MPRSQALRFEELPDLCRVPEIAQYLRCGTATVYTLIRTHQLHAITLGRSLRVPKVAVERFTQDPAAGALSHVCQSA